MEVYRPTPFSLEHLKGEAFWKGFEEWYSSLTEGEKLLFHSVLEDLKEHHSLPAVVSILSLALSQHLLPRRSSPPRGRKSEEDIRRALKIYQRVEEIFSRADEYYLSLLPSLSQLSIPKEIIKAAALSLSLKDLAPYKGEGDFSTCLSQCRLDCDKYSLLLGAYLTRSGHPTPHFFLFILPSKGGGFEGHMSLLIPTPKGLYLFDPTLFVKATKGPSPPEVAEALSLSSTKVGHSLRRACGFYSLPCGREREIGGVFYSYEKNTTVIAGPIGEYVAGLHHLLSQLSNLVPVKRQRRGERR